MTKDCDLCGQPTNEDRYCPDCTSDSFRSTLIRVYEVVGLRADASREMMRFAELRGYFRQKIKTIQSYADMQYQATIRREADEALEWLDKFEKN